MNDINLPKHWKKIKLSNQDLFNFESGIWKGKKEPLEECTVVRNTNFTSDGYLDLTDVAVLPIEQRHLVKKSLKWGDIVIERSGGGPKQPVGRVVFFNLNDAKYCFSNFTSRLRVIDRNTVFPSYLFFFLLYFHDSGQTRQLQQRTTGIRNLMFQNYKDTTIPLPPLPEQRAIAHVLQTIQEAKFTRQREIALEQERKAALMDYLFSHGTKGEPRKRTEIGEIPESWEVTKLGDLLKLKSGVSRPKDIESKPNAKLTVPVYGGNGILGYTSEKFSDQRLLVIGRVGEYCGCVHIAESPNWITDNALYSEKWFSSEILLDFLAGQLKYFNLNRFQRRGGQPLVTQSILHQLKIPLPPFTEQRAIAAVFQAIDEKIAALEREVEHLDELFHAMLDELMTGRRSAVPLIESGVIQ
ncbi:hypothetical protein C6499_01475 [Candidatus Poribacteria bacterium]|nr:MAG: hypothetical protein C6499_01475 [Candidatus Poribacteria bacterium]